MKELRPESQKALKVIEEADPEAISSSRAILDFFEDHPIYESQYVKEEGELEWSIDVYKVGYQFIRALIPYYTKPDVPVCQRMCKEVEFDFNSLAIVYPVKVMMTRYKTLEEINGKNYGIS